MRNLHPELDLNPEVFVTEFSGLGGACEGYHRATGRNVDIAVNHNREAIAGHRMNHPDTRHFEQDVFEVDPIRDVLEATNGRIGGAWFSPDCRHFSKAKGAALLDRRVRGLAWVIRKYCGRGGALRIGPSRIPGKGPACPRVIFLENVEEFRGWGPLIAARDKKTGRVVDSDGRVAAPGEHVPYSKQRLVPDPKRAGLYFNRLMSFLEEMGATGWEARELRACDYGAPTIRKRLYLIIRFDGKPIIWPAKTHGAPDNPLVKAKKLLPYRTIGECLDFTLACPSIFLSKQDAKAIGCKRPLVDNSLRRIARGIDRFVLKAKRPFIVSITHQGGDRGESIDEPSRTVTGAHRGEKALISPVVAYGQHGGGTRSAEAPLHTVTASPKDQNILISPVLAGVGGRAGQSRPRGANEPFATVTAKGDTVLVTPVFQHLTKFRAGATGASLNEPFPTVTASSHNKRPGGNPPLGVVAASVVKMRGTNTGHPVDEPAHTISAGGNHLGVVSTFLAQNNTGVVGHGADEPASTILGKGANQSVVVATLAQYYGTEQAPDINEPGATVTTKDRTGVVEAFCAIPPFGPEHVEGALRVAAFLRHYGVEFEGEYAMVGDLIIVDIGMRMLIAREMFRAQGFGDDFVIDRGMFLDEATGRLYEAPLTKTVQVRLCGNSVCPDVAAALIGANLPEMSIRETFGGNRRAA